MINKIYIFLGEKCNLSCRHCSQEEVPFKKDTTEDINAIVKYITKISSSQNKKLSIVFWGGEPLLYLSSIKELISSIGNRADYGMVTNGTLIDEDFVQYANAHKISVTLSNDGINTCNVRGVNLLEDPEFVKLFSKINRKAIESIISPYNYDYVALLKYIDEKLPNICIMTSLIRIHWDMPSDLYTFDPIRFREELHRIAIVAGKDILIGKASNAVRIFSSHLACLSIPRASDGFARCGEIKNSIGINLAGEVFVCHNSAESIGSILDTHEELMIRYKKWYKGKILSKCTTCEIFNQCRGGCPICTPQEDLSKIQCLNYKYFFEAVRFLRDYLAKGGR